MKKVLNFVYSFTLIAFVLGIFGVSTSYSQNSQNKTVATTDISVISVCTAEKNQHTVTQQSEENEFFIVGCGGFM